MKTRECPQIDACERIDLRGHHVDRRGHLSRLGFNGSNVDPGQPKWSSCSSSTKVNCASICSSDVPDEENISSFVPPTTEQGFFGAVKASASWAGITFDNDASPDSLLSAIIRKRQSRRAR